MSGVNFFSLAPLANFLTTPLPNLWHHSWEGGKGDRKEAIEGTLRGGGGGMN